MTRLPRLTIALVCAAVLLTATLHASPYSEAPDQFATALDRQMPALLDQYETPGAVVSHIVAGDVAWTRAYGLADVGTVEAMRPDHVLNHGSNGKVLTAWAVMRLVDEGRLALDAPVGPYLKRWRLPPSEFDSSGVTIRRLLSHTAGLTVHGYSNYDVRRPRPSLVEVLDGLNQDSGPVTIGWAPGSRIEYSGGGFVVLQMAVEDVTGEPFESYVRRTILEPLGMTHGGFGWSPDLVTRAARGYGIWRDEQPFRDLAAPAVGDYNAPVEDFARLLAATVPNGEPSGRGVLRPESIVEMTTPQPATDGTAGLAYGIGRLADGSAFVTHSGNNLGYFARFILVLESGNGYVVAANSQSGDPLNEMVQRIWLETALGQPTSAPAPASTQHPLAGLRFVVDVVTAVLVAGVAYRSWWLARQGRCGQRIWTGSTRRAAVSVGALGLVAVFWWYWFLSALPLPLPPTVGEQTLLYLTRLCQWLFAALWLWLAYAVARSLFPLSLARRKPLDRPV